MPRGRLDREVLRSEEGIPSRVKSRLGRFGSFLLEVPSTRRSLTKQRREPQSGVEKARLQSVARRRGWILALAVVTSTFLVGLWLALDSTPDSALRSSVERLKSLPYLSWSRTETDSAFSGVTLVEPDQAAPGVNLYASEVASGARFLDMSGRVVGQLYDHRDEPTLWKLVKPLADGSFGVLAAGGTVLRVDRRSRVLFEHTDRFHHDFDFTADGLLVAAAWRTRRLPAISRLKPVKDDVLLAVDAAGRTRWEVSMAEAVISEPVLLEAARSRPDRILDWQKNTLHTNTVAVLRRGVTYDNGLTFPAGSVLTCWRNLDTVAVLDVSPGAEGNRVLWHWGLDELDLPHHPTLLDNGNLLIFDNGTRRGWSRVVEVNPVTGKIDWKYNADPPESFYSSSRGAAERLDNGNTLIVESQRGRAFEVTREGEIVWEFVEPRTRERGILGTRERATIYRMARLPETRATRTP